MADDPTLAALIADNPELDAAELESAYFAMEDPADWPRPYGAAERRAHEIVLAYLQHLGTPDWDHTTGELSDRSRETIIDKARLVMVEDDGELAALIPWDVLKELLADHITALNSQAAHRNGGSAQDIMLGYVQGRMTDDIARRAWLDAH